MFLAAFVKGVDEYQDFLRCSVASAGNDHRLGANEAPPVIISIYLGDELHAVVESIINGSNYTDPEKNIMRIGVDVLPPIPKDTTDRNRTSPLAFTGNKFEFRMLGSSQSIAGPNIALNTIMAEELSKFADILENAEDFDATLHQLVSDTFRQHQRILFNGNGYSDEWCQEAAQRGLSNLRSTTQAMPRYVSDKNVELVTKHGIFSESEFRARNEIHLETYRKILNIEAKATADIAMRQILPAVSKYSSDLADRIIAKSGIGCSCCAERTLAKKLSEGVDRLYQCCETLSGHLKAIPVSSIQAADYCYDVIAPAMEAVRKEADALELLTDKAEELFHQGKSFEDICKGVMDYKEKTGLMFSLECLNNLANNGRVSPVVAKIAGVLGIRIVGRASMQGQLEPMDKCRGEKKALVAIVKRMKEIGFAGGKVIIDHCFNPNAAQQLKELIAKEFPTANITISVTGGLCSFYAENGGLLAGFEIG
mgnify:CR=1 FL=1